MTVEVAVHNWVHFKPRPGEGLGKVFRKEHLFLTGLYLSRRAYILCR
jgi:hypothetical protein